MNIPHPIIDAHAHLWLHQDTVVNGQVIRELGNGRSEFFGEIRQMLPPFILDGRNTAEIFLSNMDYAQVSAAVITQEYIDGNQNEYLWDVYQRYPDRFRVCGLVDMRRPEFLSECRTLIDQGFGLLKIPAHRLFTENGCISLVSDEAMALYRLMSQRGVILSIDLADGDTQVAEMNEIIAENPDLKIAIGHFGMVTTDGWTEQIKLARNSNVMVESGGITWLFNDEFYPFRGAVRAVRQAADLVGYDKLMWGSDYPRTIVAITYRMSYDWVLKTDELTDEQKAQFLGLNAQRFYGFGNLPHLPYIKNMSE